MEDLKFIIYQGHCFDQSEEAWDTFPSIGFQQRNKLTNQRALNEINVPAITTNNKKKTQTNKLAYENLRWIRNWHLITCTHD